MIRCSSSFARYKVLARDDGVCAVCGCDTKLLSRALSQARRDGDAHPLDLTALCCELGFNCYYYEALWQADHIVPVVEGGGACGLENLRTLCTPCHKEETRTLRRRLARGRRGQSDLLESNQ
jgi:5-methylcytosine-specific restriction endonuclease McrA